MLAGAVIGGAILWCGRGAKEIAMSHVQPAAVPAIAAELSHAPVAVVPPSVLTRRQAAELVKTIYRKEILAWELDLEQQRYGRNYWEAGGDGPQLAKLARAKEAMLRQLSADANQLLNDSCPGEPGEPVTFAAMFDAAHPGPNLACLSPDLREQFEAEILAEDDEGRVDPEHLLEVAEHMLPAAELEAYRNWNSPLSAALREQLAGFNPTEAEFAAIRSSQAAAGDDEPSGTEAELATQLGTARYGEYLWLTDPAMQAAVHDLRRLGLALDDANWLAATRSRAVAEIGEAWRSDAFTDAGKRERVAQLEHDYSQTIAARLALPNASLDGLNPGS